MNKIFILIRELIQAHKNTPNSHITEMVIFSSVAITGSFR